MSIKSKGSEWVGIVALLILEKQPTQRIKDAVQGARSWFESHKIAGIKIDTEITSENKKNGIVIADIKAPTLWARFYD